MSKIAIIGAGIAGLTIANELAGLAEITVFEKSRGLGGRMATRRVDDFHFDHGAQYFVAKSAEFQQFLQAPLAAGAIKQWGATFVEFDGENRRQQKTWDDSFPHYVGTPTMSALARFMSKDITIRGSVQVAEIRSLAAVTEITAAKAKQQWQLIDNEGKTLGDYDWVLTTCPVEQARALLPQSFNHHQALNSINMQACFAVMLGFEQAVDLSFQAALVRNADISWVALNSHKPERPEKSAILIQSSNEWAQVHAEDDKEQLKQYLIQETERVIGVDLSGAAYSSIHRWLYANTAKQKVNVGEVFLDAENQLAAAGDWCGSARVESAFLHGQKLANELRAVI